MSKGYTLQPAGIRCQAMTNSLHITKQISKIAESRLGFLLVVRRHLLLFLSLQLSTTYEQPNYKTTQKNKHIKKQSTAYVSYTVFKPRFYLTELARLILVSYA